MRKDGPTNLIRILSNLLMPTAETQPEPECAPRTEIPLAELSEGELVARAQAGDREAFGVLYDNHYPAILNYLFRRTLNAAVAEDLTSNTFFAVLKALPRYRHKDTLRAWLYQIATNQLRMHWRTQRRHPRVEPEGEEDWQAVIDRVAFAGHGIEAVAEREEAMANYAALHAALREVPEPYQTALVLRYFEALPYEQLARAMDKRLGTVKSLVSRGVDKLREIFLRRRATR